MGIILLLLLLAQNSSQGPGATTSEATFWLSYSPTDANPVLNDRGIFITINGSGPYTTSVSNNTCLQWSKTSGTAPETIMLRPGYFCSGIGGPGVGTHNFTASISGAESRTINVTIQVRPSWPYPLMVSSNRLANMSAVCSEPWRANWQVCPYTPTRPGSWTPPAVGESYTDPVFGTTIRRLVTGDIFRYANQHMVNYDETHLLTLNGIVNLRNGQYVLTYNDTTRGLDLRWFPEEGSPPRLFSMKEADTGITTYTLNGATLSQQDRYECGIGQLNSWFNGASREGWVARSNYANTHICAINVLTGERIVGLASAPSTNGRDNLYISRSRDRVTGLHYLWYGGDRGVVFAFKSGDSGFTPLLSRGLSKAFGSQSFDGEGFWDLNCANSSWCIGQDHVDTVDVDGEQALVTQNGWVLYFNRLTDDLDAMREAQGGLQIDAVLLGHVGCADFVPYCAGYTRRSLSQTARTIVSLSGTPLRVTLDGPLPSLSNGGTVQIARVGGCTAANGNRPIAELNPEKTSFELPGVTCNSPFTSGGSASPAEWNPAGEMARNRVHVYKIGPARTQIAIGDHRSIWFDGAGDDYFSGQPWAFMSPHGKYVIWKSNLGTPDERNIMVAEINANAPGSDWLSAESQVTVTPATNSLAFSWNDPGAAQTCRLQVGTRRDFVGGQNVEVTVSDGQFSHTAGNLSAGTQYHWRAVCANFFVAAGSAVTQP